MKHKKKSFFRKLLRSRYNLVGATKIFSFRKKKWDRFKFFSRLKLRYFRRYRYQDQSRMYISKFASPGNSYKKRFRNHLIRAKGIQLMYGGFKKKKFRKAILMKSGSKINDSILVRHNDNIQTLLKFETRVDSVLVRSHFCRNILQARQFIKNGHILVNSKRIRLPSYRLNYGDCLSIAAKPRSIEMVRNNLLKSTFWPIPPSFVKINYKTLNIINISKNLGTERIFFRYNLKIANVKNDVKFM